LQWNLATGTLPALKANAEGDARDELIANAPYMEPWLNILGDAQYLGSLPDRDRLFYKIIVPNVLDVLNGQKSTEDALASIEQEANAL
jgi:ABC-type glycerol-3-phosphate transport system substrate-binding protein